MQAVAFFDEDQNLDTSFPTSWLPSPLSSRQELYSWGLAKSGGVAALRTCTTGAASDCAMPKIKQAMQAWKQQVVEAGTDPVNHPDGKSLANWIHFSNPYTYRPATSTKPAYFDTDDSSYKIRAKVDVSFVKGSDGRIVAGSESVVYTHRTGNTHLPTFVMDTFQALQTDYGIPVPDLSYVTVDLNTHDGQSRAANPQITGVLPGRSYAYAGKAPIVTDGVGNPVTNGTCVAALFASGGSIGYRPMLGTTGPSAQVDLWQRRALGNPKVPAAVANVAAEIYNMFFKPGSAGSLFVQAPPIWQELNFLMCADGNVRQNSGRPVLRSSLMPSQYLYLNNLAIGLNGGKTGKATPVVGGDFYRFSRVPDAPPLSPEWANPHGACDAGSGRRGNPWDMTPNAASPSPGLNPAIAHLCSRESRDIQFSSS